MIYKIFSLVVVLTITVNANAQDKDMSSVKNELDKRRAEFSATAPEKKQSDFEEGIKLVEEAGIVQQAKQVGDKAPDFTLPNADGEDVTLSNLLKDGPVILVWYRGGWCPYCNIHLNFLQGSLPMFAENNAQLVAIGPELPDHTAETQDKNSLKFEVLSDVQNKVGKDYKIVYELPDFIADYYNDAFDLLKYNGDESNELPLSATYVIGTDGIIKYAFLDADYRNRSEASDIIAALKKLDK